MKKKLTTLLLMMATLLMLAAGCSGGKSDPIVGDWSATKIKAAGIELDLATFAEQAGMEISAEFTFTNDGKFNGTVTNGEESETSDDGTWKATDNGYDLTIDDETITATLTEGELTMNIEGVEMVFEKGKEK